MILIFFHNTASKIIIRSQITSCNDYTINMFCHIRIRAFYFGHTQSYVELFGDYTHGRTYHFQHNILEHQGPNWPERGQLNSILYNFLNMIVTLIAKYIVNEQNLSGCISLNIIIYILLRIVQMKYLNWWCTIWSNFKWNFYVYNFFYF